MSNEYTFRGTFPCAVDQKRRLTVPSRFAKALTPRAKRTFVAVHGLERCLSLYPLDWWQVFERELQLAQMTDATVRRGMRRLLASTEDLELDAQNRITLSPGLLEYAQIKGQTVLNGMIDRLELWSPEGWKSYLAEEGTPSYEQSMVAFGEIMQRTALLVREQRDQTARGEEKQ